MKDELGKRMKSQYEMRTKTYLPRRTYTIIRLDGKCFGTFTKNMKRPYDEKLINAMDKTAQFLCKEIQGCEMAYVQSDEISLLLTDFKNITTNAWFDAQVQKMVSVAASLATVKFNQIFLKNKIDEYDPIGEEIDIQEVIRIILDTSLAIFDARAFTIPDPTEVENYFVWRQKDAIRNSIIMHAQSLYSHNELNGKSQVNMHDMIHDKGENWNDLPEGFKRGRTILKVRNYDIETYNHIDEVIDLGIEWVLKTPDFLKERETLSNLIPRIS